MKEYCEDVQCIKTNEKSVASIAKGEKNVEYGTEQAVTESVFSTTKHGKRVGKAYTAEYGSEKK